MEKNKGGRPSKYKPEFNQIARDYVDSCNDDVKEFHKTRGDKSDTFERVMEANFPIMPELAHKLGVNKATMFRWCEDHPEFRDSLDYLVEKQEAMLLRGGAKGLYNSTITKLILSSNHGYKEKSDVTSGDKPIPILGVIDDKKE